ncbi:MFS transporter [Xylogone sp. PMI_703]|nr:MFS transporter [Xylogone sp. PMI_703]
MGSPEIVGAESAQHHDAEKIPAKATEAMDTVHLEQTLSGGYPVKNFTDYTRVDDEVAKYAGQTRVVIDEATNRRLKRLIDRRVLIIMVITYFLQALDKGTLSFASIMGIQKDAHLVGQQYSWLTTCIYIAILIVEYPTNWIIQRVPIAKYLSINIMLWGMILMFHALAKNFTHLVVLRTLLGIFECCCQPSFIVLSSMWYLREEQASAVSYWYMMNGGQQIVGGLLAYCFSLLKKGPLLSWQALFITYGAIAILWGAFVFFWMPDSPMRAKCFTEEDKKLMVERVRVNQTGLQNRQFKREQMWEAFRDPQTWCYSLIAFCTTLPTSGLGAFANIIINSLHFTVLQTQLLAMVLGFYIIIVLLTSAWLVKKTGQNCYTMLGFVIPSYIGTIVLMTVINHNKATQVGLLISYYITLSFWSAQTLGLAMISRNIAGQTKKATVVATNFIIWSAGNAIGPQVFLARDAPRYFTAFAVHIGCYTLLVIVLIFLRWYLVRQNNKKDELAAAGIQEAMDDQYIHAFEDLTDKENPNFRYVI